MNIVSGFTLQLILEKQLAFKYWHSIKQEYTDYLKRLLKYFSFFQIHIIHEAKFSSYTSMKTTYCKRLKSQYENPSIKSDIKLYKVYKTCQFSQISLFHKVVIFIKYVMYNTAYYCYFEMI